MLEWPILAGRLTRLEPISAHHADSLAYFATDPGLWTHMAFGNRSQRDALDRYIAYASEEAARDAALTFAIIDITSNCAIGSTSLGIFH